MLSTTPDSPSRHQTAAGQPTIITDMPINDNIRLLFDMQALVDGLSVPFPAESGTTANASLASICWQPMGPGTACGIESVLQYWQMDPKKYAA